MRPLRNSGLYIVLFSLILAMPAEAYIGPGAGIGMIASFLGVLGAIGLALVAIVWYPLKRLIRRVRAATGKSPDAKKGDR